MPDKDSPTTTAGTLEFHYVKSPLHRVVHISGGIGGPGVRGVDLMLSLFSERQPIPVSVTHAVETSGKLGPEHVPARVGRTGVVREVEVTLALSPSDALSIGKWIVKHAQALMDAAQPTVGEGGE
jgi:hydrogenase maturation factor